MRPVTLNVNDTQGSLKEIQTASHEGEVTEIAQNFVIDNPAFTQTLALNTTAPTAANLALVLASLISIMQRGGLSRTT
jgi:hypothetical protein